MTASDQLTMLPYIKWEDSQSHNTDYLTLLHPLHIPCPHHTCMHALSTFFARKASPSYAGYDHSMLM